MSQNIKTEKIIEIQLVRATEVCGKVLSEKNGYKSVKTALFLSNVLMQTTNTAVCLQTKASFSSPLWVLIGVLAKFYE